MPQEHGSNQQVHSTPEAYSTCPPPVVAPPAPVLPPVVASPAPAGPPMREEGASAEDVASFVQSPTRQPSSTAASEGWSDEVDTSPGTTHILQMLDSSPSQDTIITLHEQQVAAAVREGEMDTELLLAETSNAPSQSDEETDGAAEAGDPTETARPYIPGDPELLARLEAGPRAFAAGSRLDIIDSPETESRASA